MRKKYVYAALLCVLSSQVAGVEFCDGADFVTLDKILSTPGEYIGKRVQTHAVLMTDAKEYTRLSLAEHSGFTILASGDDETTSYFNSHKLPVRKWSDLVDDLFTKVRAAEGPTFKPHLSMIQYYRQNVTACGRLIKDQGELRFALDELRVENSYLLPLPPKNGKRK